MTRGERGGIVTFVVILGLLGLFALVLYFLSSTPVELTSADQQTYEELRSVEYGDIVEAQNGYYYIVWGHIHRSEFPIFRMLYKDRGVGMNNYHFRDEEIRRIIRHDDPEAEAIWAQMRPVPEEKMVEARSTE